jgi:hypothetical protein
VNLFWYHTTPGHHRAQFPSWSWAGWQGGSISSKSFINKTEEHSVLHSGTAVWIEEKCGSLHNVGDIPTLPDTWLPYQESRFIHIETRIMTSSISYLTSHDLNRLVPGSYDAFQINRITCYARVYPSGSYTSVHPTQYTGLTPLRTKRIDQHVPCTFL